MAAVLAVLTQLPADGTIAVVAALAWVLTTWRVAILAICALGFCWLMRLWIASLQTIALVLVSVTLSIAIAFPLGVIAAQTLSNATSITPMSPALIKQGGFKHGSLLDGKILQSRASSQRKSTLQPA